MAQPQAFTRRTDRVLPSLLQRVWTCVDNTNTLEIITLEGYYVPTTMSTSYVVQSAYKTGHTHRSMTTLCISLLRKHGQTVRISVVGFLHTRYELDA